MLVVSIKEASTQPKTRIKEPIIAPILEKYLVCHKIGVYTQAISPILPSYLEKYLVTKLISNYLTLHRKVRSCSNIFGRGCQKNCEKLLRIYEPRS